MKTADFEKNFSSMHESGSAMQMMLREETPLVVNFDFSLAHKFWQDLIEAQIPIACKVGNFLQLVDM